jgi:hypothetical protein
MNLQKMISELRAEKLRLDDAIVALERLSITQPKRRGRPPQWMKAKPSLTEEPDNPEEEELSSSASTLN